MKFLKEMVMYIIFLFILFFVGPLVMSGPESDWKEWYTILLYLNPICVAVAGLVAGFRHGFRWQYLLFIPIFYTTSSLIFNPDTDAAIVYSAIYLAVLALAMFIGFMVAKLWNKFIVKKDNY